MAINLSGSIRNALRVPKTFIHEREGNLDEVNLLIDTTLAWHFRKLEEPNANREAFILEYFAKRYDECNGVARANIKRLAQCAGKLASIKDPNRGGAKEISMVTFKFDMLYSFVVGVNYASPDAYPFESEFIEETLKTINQ